MTTSPLVSTSWLADALGAPDLVVFDATYYLPAEKRDARAEFAAGHIPGARFFDVDGISDPDTDLPHMIPSPGRFAKLMGELGLRNTDRVVFYDQKGLFSAARGWWLMGLFGHDRASVLDGGLPKWRAEQRPMQTGAPDTIPPGDFLPAFRSSRLSGVGDVMASLANGDALVLDARAAARFSGAQPETRPGVRSGHMPGARNLPFTDLLNADQTMLPPEQLRARFADAGVDGKRPVVTSCGSGVTASVVTLGMAVAGLPIGSLYDGSWTEWGSRPDTPVETSAAKDSNA